MQQTFKWPLILFGLFFFFFLLCGELLDGEAERVVDQLYPRTTRGVIKGADAIEVLRGSTKAFVLIHGFLDTPQTFAGTIEDMKQKTNADLYAPLLPYHGKNLQEASQLNNEKVLFFLDNYIAQLSKKYESLTVVGFSYSGALLSRLAGEKKIPNKVHLVLYAPALFIRPNNFWHQFELQTYRFWRNYCNYQALECGSPNYESVDSQGRGLLEEEKSFRYVVVSATKKLFEFDRKNRANLAKIPFSFELVEAADDNRVNVEEQKKSCATNPYCHITLFPSGRHLLHWSVHKEAFETWLARL